MTGMAQRWLGTVVAIQANYYSVQLDETAVLAEVAAFESERLGGTIGEPFVFLCIRRSLLKKLGQQIMVGDRVTVEELDWQGMRGAISSVLPRGKFLDRPPIANVDRILLVFALAEPMLDANQLSRFLVKAESTGLATTLCLNKRDLIDEQQVNEWRDRLSGWGYQPVLASIQSDEALPVELADALREEITVLAGPSGVGKSSLTNRLIPQQDLRVSAVSGKLGRGRHTTRHVELFELPEGGFLADTPGFNQPDVACTPQELGKYFPEIRKRRAIADCQFSDCLHRDEPGCAVRGDWERYEHYLTLLEEVVVVQQHALEQGEAEATEKVKMLEDGKVLKEPRLEAKKYRRTSRKSRKQAFQELCLDLSAVEDLEELEDLEDLGL